MTTFEYEPSPPPPPEPFVHQVPQQTDPLGVVGLLTVVGATLFVGVQVWNLWDISDGFRFVDVSEFGDETPGPSTIDRLRVLGEVTHVFYVLPLLLGVALASLRDLLRLLDAPSVARKFARVIGAIGGAGFAAGGLAMAIDVAFIRDIDEDEFFWNAGETRWQNVLWHVGGALLGAACVWIVVRREGRRTAAPVPSGIWPYVNEG
jgi:hypothetical protein